MSQKPANAQFEFGDVSSRPPPWPAIDSDLWDPLIRGSQHWCGQWRTAFSSFNDQWVDFIQRRIAADFALPQHILSGRTPVDVWATVTEFLQTAILDYQTEFAEIGQFSLKTPFGDDRTLIGEAHDAQLEKPLAVRVSVAAPHGADAATALPLRQALRGPDGIDIGRLYRDIGCFVYDPGFTTTACCTSGITFIDGEKGELLYRGYPIEQLAEHSNYLAVCYLLLYGDLPTNEAYRAFRDIISHHTMVHEQMTRFYMGFRRDAHPMAVMVGAVGALSAFYGDSTDIEDPLQRTIAIDRLIAKIPTIAAMAYKYSLGQPMIYPRNDFDYASNFLQMCFAVPCEPYVVNPAVSRALDRIFILHADHEQNAATATVRLAGSSGANPFACIAAGLACLWGARHGGRNEAVYKMLEQIGSVDGVADYVRKAKDKTSGVRLWGIGHPIYKTYDPRAKMMRQICCEVLDALGRRNEPLFQVALELERIVLDDDDFVSHGLYPTIDFYSGLALRAMGFPVSMFTVLFAMARSVGSIAHWNEMIEDPNQRISRPRQLYVGPQRRDFPAGNSYPQAD